MVIQITNIMNLRERIANNKFLKKYIPKKNLNSVHSYWLTRNSKGSNAYTDYFKNEESSQFLVDLIKKYSDEKEIKILEVGCNVGRNLNVLFKNGYKNLNGIEINPNAIDAMRKHYSDMTKTVKIFNNKIEDVIKGFTDNEFDVVFSMAVLMHIHHDSEWVFDHLFRITKHYMITIEDETGVAMRNFPRDYKQVFEEIGLKEIECVENIPYFGHGYIARVFTTDM